MKNNFKPEDIFETIEISVNFFRSFGLRLGMNPNSIVGMTDRNAMLHYKEPFLTYVKENNVSNSQLNNDVLRFAIYFVLRLDENAVPNDFNVKQKRKFKNTIEGVTLFMSSLMGITLEFDTDKLLSSKIKIV